MSMKLGVGNGIVRQARPGRPRPITATSLPTLAQLYVGDTILSGYTSGTYASSAGIISSEVETYYKNGVSVLSSATVADGDQIRVTSVVTDALGNVRTFNTATVIVTYTAPTVSAQPTITPAMDEPGSVFTLALGTITDATPAIDYFRFNDVDVTSDLIGLTYTPPAGIEGRLTLRVVGTNSGGTVYSDEIEAVANAAPVITLDDFDDAATPPLYSFETNETGMGYWVLNGTLTAIAGADIKAAVDSETGNLFGTFLVDVGDNQFEVDLSGITNGTYGLHRTILDSLGGYATDAVTEIVVSGAADVTAPTLSSPTDAADGSTAMTGSVSTNEGNGTLYWVVSTSATAPSAAQVKAGQMHTGSAAAASGSQAVSTTGVQNVSDTGLTASTAYYTHYMHEDAATNQSAVVSADGFTTAAAAGLTLVGVTSGTGAGDKSLTTLTGGIASSPSEGDIVLVAYATGSAGDAALEIKDASGGTDYTLIGSELHSNDNNDSGLRVAYKVMGPTTDTSFYVSDGSATGRACIAQVWRGQHATPLDVAAVTATGIDGTAIDPPAITPVTSGAKIFVVGACAHQLGSVTITQSYLSDATDATFNGSGRDVSLVIGSVDWTSGEYNPATMTVTGATSSDSWSAVVFAVKPA